MIITENICICGSSCVCFAPDTIRNTPVFYLLLLCYIIQAGSSCLRFGDVNAVTSWNQSRNLPDCVHHLTDWFLSSAQRCWRQSKCCHLSLVMHGSSSVNLSVTAGFLSARCKNLMQALQHFHS